jgi:hypothetical protein
MTDTTIDRILSFDQGSSAKVLHHLGCVVQWRPGTVAQTLHASFADYLTDTGRSGEEPWSINPQTDHLLLSLGCLKILTNDLKFNICALEDSHSLNLDVPGISLLVAERVSPPLAYSSCWWFHHLHETPFNENVLEALSRVMYHKVLYWLEILSLLGQIPIVTTALTFGFHYTKV